MKDKDYWQKNKLRIVKEPSRFRRSSLGRYIVIAILVAASYLLIKENYLKLLINTQATYERSYDGKITRSYTCDFTDSKCVNAMFDREKKDQGLEAPTLAQLNKLVRNLKTSKHPYDFPYFICSDFAHSLILEARKHKIPALYVGLEYENSTVGHAIVAFQLDTQEVLYFDSTSNSKHLVKLENGRRPIFFSYSRKKDSSKSYVDFYKEAESVAGIEKEVKNLKKQIDAHKLVTTNTEKVNHLILRHNSLANKVAKLARMDDEHGFVKKVTVGRLNPNSVREKTLAWVESQIGQAR